MASFCGGAVGVLSTLMVVEMNNARKQSEMRCVYCGVRACPSAACEGSWHAVARPLHTSWVLMYNGLQP